jgi:hypothetical protein
MILTTGMGMMFGKGRRPIELVESKTFSSSSSSGTRTLTLASSPQAGDLLFFGGFHNVANFTATITGFSTVFPAGNRAFLLAKKAGAGEGTVYTVTFSTSAISAVFMLVFRAAKEVSDTSAGAVSTQSSGVFTGSAFTATNAGTLLFFSCVNHTTGAGSVTSPPAGMDQVAYWFDVEAAKNTGPTAALYMEEGRPSGDTGTRTLTMSTSASASPCFMFQVPQG